MYETLREDDESFKRYHIMWFPKKFEGIVLLGMRHIDIRGRCVIELNTYTNKYWISPKLKTMEDLHTFMTLVMNKTIKPTDIYKLNNWTDHGYSVD